MTNHFRKAILLAGGSGSRLHPLTRAMSKQLLPVYDKPMVYYPLSVLMTAGIREVLVISTPSDIGGFQRLLGDGSQIGMELSYAVQPRPEGLAQAFVIGREFVGSDACALVLGDNLLHGPQLQNALQPTLQRETGATIFGYPVSNPEQFGVVEFDANGNVLSLEEKPRRPRSNFAVPGLYFYDNDVLDIAATLQPSARGELEITDVNRVYLQSGKLKAEVLGDDVTWMDAGTHESLLRASQFVYDTEMQTGVKIGCIEEIAFRQNWMDSPQLESLAGTMRNEYGRYLLKVLEAASGTCTSVNHSWTRVAA